MKRLIIVLIISFIGAGHIFAQDQTPDEKTIVNKKFDENGNLIQYDSTYIHQWSSDSTFNFSFDDNFALENGFPDISNLLREFFGDSINSEFGMHRSFPFSPFDDEDFFGNFNHHFNDSLLIGSFPFNKDSLFNAPFQFKNLLPSIFNFKDLEELQKQFSQFNFNFPEFKTQEQKEEWKKLMEKHQKEKEELMKKWEK